MIKDQNFLVLIFHLWYHKKSIGKLVLSTNLMSGLSRGHEAEACQT